MDDLEQIRQLKYRYLRTLDTKCWEEFEDCFTEDVTADYAGLRFGDRAALVAYMRENLGSGTITVHQVHHPEVRVLPGGDEAEGRWYLQDRVVVEPLGFLLEGAAFYEDRYRRTERGWRVCHTGYQRTYEVSYDLAALPGLRVATGPAVRRPDVIRHGRPGSQDV